MNTTESGMVFKGILTAVICTQSMLQTSHLLAAAPVIHEQFILIPDDSAEGNSFGLDVAIHNGIIAVCEPTSMNQPEKVGAVYLFDALTGLQINKFLPDENSDSFTFGWNLAMNENVVVVGPGGFAFGTVFIFDLDTGVQVAELQTPTIDFEYSYFGLSIAMDEQVLAVSDPYTSSVNEASGAVYLYNASTGVFLSEIRPDIKDPGESFGNVVAINDGILAVRSVKQDPVTSAISSFVYLFDIDTDIQLHRLKVENYASSFGFDLALDNNILIASSLGELDGKTFVNAVYGFDITSGTQLFRISHPDQSQSNTFGREVDISNGKIVIADGSNGGTHDPVGAVYMFSAATGNHLATLVSDQSNGQARIFTPIATENGLVIARTSARLNNGINVRAMLLFDTNCPADFNEDYQLDLADVNHFVLDLMSNSSTADLNNDGNFDFFDVSAFLSAFAQGCP